MQRQMIIRNKEEFLFISVTCLRVGRNESYLQMQLSINAVITSAKFPQKVITLIHVLLNSLQYALTHKISCHG